MNCTCLEELSIKLEDEGNQQGPYKGRIEAVHIETVLVFGKVVESYTFSNVDIEVKGMKKKKQIKLIHHFCPFCGKETNKKDKQEAPNERA